MSLGVRLTSCAGGSVRWKLQDMAENVTGEQGQSGQTGTVVLGIVELIHRFLRIPICSPRRLFRN